MTENLQIWLRRDTRTLLETDRPKGRVGIKLEGTEIKDKIIALKSIVLPIVSLPENILYFTFDGLWSFRLRVHLYGFFFLEVLWKHGTVSDPRQTRLQSEQDLLEDETNSGPETVGGTFRQRAEFGFAGSGAVGFEESTGEEENVQEILVLLSRFVREKYNQHPKARFVIKYSFYTF